MLKVRKINDFKFIGRESWSDILKQSRQNYIFQTYEYLSAWWENFGKNKKDRYLLILLVEDGSSLAAIAPLMVKRYTLLGNRPIIQFIGTDICDYMDLIIDAKRCEECFLKIFEYLSRVGYLELDLKYLSEDSEILKHFNGQNILAGNYGHIRQVDHCPYIGLSGNKNDAFDVGLPQRLLSEIKRNERRLELRGNIVCKIFTDEAPSKDVITEYFNLHVRKWSTHNVKYSQFQRKEWKNFVVNLCSSLAGKGWLDFSYLELNKKMIACHFGFRYNNKFYYYMPTFDPEFAAYSPSKILIRKMLERIARDGLAEFDFLRGTEPYKSAWTDQSRPVYNMYCYSRSNLLRYLGILRRKIMDTCIHDIKPQLKRIAPLMSVWYDKKRRF